MTALRPALLALLLLLAGCATGPRFAVGALEADLGPQDVAERLATFKGRRFVWGGRIVAAENLADRTRLQILAYPLDRSQRPRTDRPALGRFLAERRGYLETADYAPGRLVTVQGWLRDSVAGRVGEAPYRFPLLEVEQLYLWPLERPAEGWRAPIQFGIGVLITN